jgi:hypothetical protein
MIKAAAKGAAGEPVLIMGLGPKEIEALSSRETIVTRIRSRAGIEATLILTGVESDDDPAFAAAIDGVAGVVVHYRGPCTEAG